MLCDLCLNNQAKLLVDMVNNYHEPKVFLKILANSLLLLYNYRNNPIPLIASEVYVIWLFCCDYIPIFPKLAGDFFSSVIEQKVHRKIFKFLSNLSNADKFLLPQQLISLIEPGKFSRDIEIFNPSVHAKNSTPYGTFSP